MVDQTTLRPTQANGQFNNVDSPIADGVIGNLAELGSNIAGLIELQAQLAVADIKESTREAVNPLVMIAAGLVLLLAALPVALIGASELLSDLLHLSHRGLAYLIVAGVTVVPSVVLIVIGVPRLSRCFTTLIRSKEELARNVAWIKTVLANSGRHPIHRRR